MNSWGEDAETLTNGHDKPLGRLKLLALEALPMRGKPVPLIVGGKFSQKGQAVTGKAGERHRHSLSR